MKFLTYLLTLFFLDETKLLKAPNLGDSNNVTQKYFSNINVKWNIVISQLRGKIKQTSQSFENYTK